MTSVDMREALEIANFKGTFVEAVDAGMLPAPEWMPFDKWIRYRQKEGRRPPRKGLDKLMVYLEELKIWNRVMKHYHGPSDAPWETIEQKHAEAFMSVESYLNSLEEVFDNEEISEGREHRSLGASTDEGSSYLTLSAVPKGIAAGVRSSIIVLDPATVDSTYSCSDSPPYSEQFSSESNEYSSADKDDHETWLDSPRLSVTWTDPHVSLQASYEAYGKLMTNLYDSLGMSFTAVDERTHWSKFWDTEITLQLSYVAAEDRLAWLNRLFKHLCHSNSALWHGEEKGICLVVIMDKMNSQKKDLSSISKSWSRALTKG